MTQEEIKTKKIIIVDDNDNVKMELRTDCHGNPQIILRDKSGNPSINLCLDDENKPSLTLNASDSMIPGTEIDGNTFSSNQLLISQEGENMALFIRSGIYGSRIVLRIIDNNEAVFVLFDENNKIKTTLTSNSKPYGDLLLFDEEGGCVAALSQFIRK